MPNDETTRYYFCPECEQEINHLVRYDSVMYREYGEVDLETGETEYFDQEWVDSEFEGFECPDCGRRISNIEDTHNDLTEDEYRELKGGDYVEKKPKDKKKLLTYFNDQVKEEDEE